MTRKSREWAALAAVAVLALASASAGSGQAAGIVWETRGGPFQLCLDAEAKGWLNARVALVVNEDPAASKIDDAAVAQWATEALKTCAAKAGGSDAASEQQFMRHMAHWREHIYRAADALRRQDRPD